MNITMVDCPAPWWNLGVLILGVLVLTGIAVTMPALIRSTRAPASERLPLALNAFLRMLTVMAVLSGALLFWGFNAHEAACGGSFFRWDTAANVGERIAFLIVPILIIGASRAALLRFDRS